MTKERPRRSATRSSYTTRSGKTIALKQTPKQKRQASKSAAANRKAAYLSAMPKEWWKKPFYLLSPKRFFGYWFSREGGIMALKIMGVGFVVGFLVLVGVFAYFRKDLPKIKDISGSNFGGSVTYYDRTGTQVLFQDYDERKRVPVADEQISDYVKHATIAIEDKDFYNHNAFDMRGIMRAALNDLKGSEVRQGGSTITQQLVKINEGWTNDRTITRKIKELILAVELEREYSKKEILVGYLNMAPYGNVNYGIETASQDYFGVSAKDLSLPQAALLAGIPKAPTAFSPFSSPEYNPSLSESLFDREATLDRQRYILDKMAEQGYITKKEAEDAKKVDVLAQVQQLKPHYSGIKAPYFVLSARNELRHTFKEAVVSRGGWKVITTLDMDAQKIAEDQVASGVRQIRAQGADNLAFVAQDVETGQVVALVGGVDFNNQEYGQINYASDVNISPGSSIKPYDYAAFIDNNTNVGAGSVLMDTLGPLPQYPCTNKNRPKDGGNCLFDYDFKQPGPQTLRYALGGSRNIPAAKAFLSSVPNDKSSGRVNSINNSMKYINNMMNGNTGYRCFTPGVDVTTATKEDESQCYASASIGDGAYLHLDEHVNGISTIARGGKAVEQTYILEVKNASGKVLKKYEKKEGKQVIKPDTAYIVSDMAADPRASYLAGSCNGDQSCSNRKFHRYKGWHTAIKTGTTNDQYDALMVSWNTKYAVGIWVGHHTRTKAYGGFGENMTAPIMKGFMQKALDLAGPAKNWEEPAGIKKLPAYVVRTATGSGQGVPSVSTDLFPSWYSGRTNAASSSQTIDKVSKKLATTCTPSLARSTVSNANVANWNVDVFAGGNAGTSSPVQGSDDVHNCNDSKPSVAITAVNGVATGGGSASCPAAGCKIMVYVDQGTHALSSGDRPDFPGTVNLMANGQSVGTVQVGGAGGVEMNYKPAEGMTGQVTLTAQVIDSVLYDSTSSGVTVTIVAPVTAPVPSPSPTNPPSNGGSPPSRRGSSSD